MAQIIYSSLISIIITMILNKLSLSQSIILNFKKKKNGENKPNKIIKSIKIKCCVFFILGFILLGLYWYYISCFCAVYKNTQIIFLKNILISYGLSIIYPFEIYLMPTILRIYSLRSNKRNKELYYKISLVLAML